jgi:hypothetical protein
LAVSPLHWQDVLRQAVAPVLAGYVLVLGCLVAYRRTNRKPSRVQAPQGSPGQLAFLRYVASTFLGGFVFFLGIIVVFYFVISGQSRSIITDALGKGSLLAFGIALPAFLFLSWSEYRRRRAGRDER